MLSRQADDDAAQSAASDDDDDDDDDESKASRSTLKSLQSKLVTLTLEIDDAVKSVTLLTGTLNKSVLAGEALQLELNEKYRNKFKEQAAIHKAEVDERLQTCDSKTAEKKLLAKELGDVLAATKAAEDKAASARAKVKEQGDAEMGAAAAAWSEGEAIRRDKWLERRTREIRDVTIKGLEPEVQRILDKHKADVEATAKALDQRKRDFLLTYSKELDAARLDVATRAEAKRDKTLATTRQAGNDRLSEVHAEHATNLNKLRKRLADEADSLRKWQGEELKRLAEAHADEMGNVRAGEARRMEDMRRRGREEKEALERQRHSAVDSLTSSSSIAKEQWDSKMRNKVQKESQDRFAAWRDELSKSRDSAIEVEIRNIQKLSVGKEAESKRRGEEEKEKEKKRHAEKVRGVLDKKSRWIEKLEECVSSGREMREQKGRHEKTLLALEEYSKKLDADIANIIEGRERRKGSVIDEEERVGTSGQREMQMIATRKAEVAKLVAECRMKIDVMTRRHAEKIRELEREQEGDLEDVERRVKRDMEVKDNKITAVEEGIQQVRTRVDHTKKMIFSYTARKKSKESDSDGGGGGGKASGGSAPAAATPKGGPGPKAGKKAMV